MKYDMGNHDLDPGTGLLETDRLLGRCDLHPQLQPLIDDTIFDTIGKPPERCFTRFASRADQVRTGILKVYAMLDLVFVTTVLVFDKHDARGRFNVMGVIDVALNFLYMAFTICMQLRISLVYSDANDRCEALEPGHIAITMLHTRGFWCDATSSLIFWTLYMETPYNYLALLRCLRCHWLSESNAMIQAFGRGSPQTVSFEVLKLFCMVFICSHLVACLCHTIGADDVTDVEGYPMHLRYLVSARQGALILLGPKFFPGDGHPKLLMETCLAPVSAVFTASIFGRIVMLSNQAGQRWSRYLERVRGSNSTLTALGCSTELCHRVAKYYSYLWMHGIDQPVSQVVSGLPSGLQTDLMMRIYERIVTRAPIFIGMPPRCLERVVLSLEQQVFCAGDTIIRKGDLGSDMFFILRGTCDVFASLCGEVVAQKGAPEFFGEVALIYPEKPRTAWILAHRFCITAKFSRESLVTVLSLYPNEEKRVVEAITGNLTGETVKGQRASEIVQKMTSRCTLKSTNGISSSALEARLAEMADTLAELKCKVDRLLPPEK